MLARKTACLSAKLSSLLLLDVGGVLLENVLRDEWWERLSHRSGRSAVELEKIFTSELKPGLWTGRISPSDFWSNSPHS
jgi:hypothetical protein